ncbi:WD40 repeat-like protein [Basidiobolus meristosporus CBS 931.73]|uniref:WD40 repeat-like protein n=1 Tax=Basidiobolus meristosporus CBS 931.73 TaxID=1314790 RepID=A0A1Y1Y7S7_9FUNG|nr:WD40 repeat-like protein [Basidiobolus meristosporus CBS 931.73]|eukprot:ORX94019.1 WD40 repeat-like protein [Basidiobolus meristosporus CBS 931.73]
MVAPVQGKLQLKASFKSVRTIESIYTGGKSDVTNDDKLLITTVGEDLEVTDLESGKRVARLAGDSEVVTTFAIKPDGKHLVSASRSLSIKVWDMSTFTIARSFKGHEAPVIVMAIDPTSTLVATGSADSTVKVWDIDKGYCTHNFKGHGGVISALKFHPDKGQLHLVSGSDDCTIRVWDLMSRKCLAVLESHVSVIRGLDFSHDGLQLISGSRDKVVNVWDLKKYKLKRTLPIYETIETVGMIKEDTEFNDSSIPKGRQLFYTGGDKGLIRLWDFETGKLVHSQKPEQNSKHTLVDVIYSTQSQTLAAVTNDQNILIYDLPSGLKRVRQIVGYNEEVIDLAYLGEDESHLAVATNSEQIRVFNLEKFDCDILYGHSDIVLCMDERRDAGFFVSGSKDNTARIWSINLDAEEAEDRFKCVGTCVGHTEAIGAVAISRKSTDFMITGSQDRTIKCWDISELDFENPDDSFKPHAMYTFKAHEKDINSVAIAPNDKYFATGSQDKTAKIWNAADGQLVATCSGHKRGVWCVQFSPVDQVFATSSGDKTIKIWSMNDFSCLKTFEGHTNSVLKVSFLTSGLQLASCASDGLVKIWTVKNNECVATLDNHTEKVWALKVRSDEKFITTGGADSVINIWEDFTEAEKEKLLAEQEETLLKEQDLANYLVKKDYRNAIALALSLNQPKRLLSIFIEVINNRPEGDESITGASAIDDTLAELSNEQLELLLTYIRDWNTNAKQSAVAQTVLNAILRAYTSEKLLEIKNIKELLDGILPYTERHFSRIDQLITNSYIMDYTLHAMDLFSPAGMEIMETEE